jgi:hypothetical protein
MHRAAEGDREDKKVDGQQVKREKPDRLVQVFLVDILDHRDLELPGQKHDRCHRQHDVQAPAEVITGVASKSENLFQPR